MAATTPYGLTKRGKVWHYDFWLNNKPYRRSTKETSYDAALAVAKAVYAGAERADAQEREVAIRFKGGEISFTNAVVKYMEDKGDRLAKADEHYKHYAWMEKHLPDGGETLLSQINGPVVRDLIKVARSEPAKRGHNRKETTKATYVPRPKADSTINRHVTQPLRQLMRWARLSWDCHVGTVNWGQFMMKEDAAEEMPRFAEVDEEELIIAALGNRGHEVAGKFLFLSGCRIAEMIGLGWKDVNLLRRTFKVTGKGKRSRVIPMTEELEALLRSQLGYDETWVFTFIAERTSKRVNTIEGQRYRLTKDGFTSHWLRALKKVGVKDFRIHDTRHTMGTRLLDATEDITLVKDVLGHASLKTTERYAHVLKDRVRKGMEKKAEKDAAMRDAQSRKSPADAPAEKRNRLKIVGNSK